MSWIMIEGVESTDIYVGECRGCGVEEEAVESLWGVGVRGMLFETSGILY